MKTAMQLVLMVVVFIAFVVADDLSFKLHPPEAAPTWTTNEMKKRISWTNYGGHITNYVRLDPKECVELGGHCFTNNFGVIYNSNPPQTEVKCKHCGHTEARFMKLTITPE